MIRELGKFEVSARAHHIVFGEAVSTVLSKEVDSGSLQRYVLVSTPGMTRQFETVVSRDARANCVGKFSEAVPHVPEEVARRAIDAARSCEAQNIVAFGGGSALDTAKAVAHWLRLPIVAIPTNFSGSEVTWNFGLTTDGVKRTVLNPDVLPRTVVYDPSLLSSLPLREGLCSGMNAIAHAVEGMYAPNANPMSSAMALAGIRYLAAGLSARQAVDMFEANAQCLAGAWLCGEVLSDVGMGLHHRICHVLGGTFGLPHAAAHTVMLPYSIDFNASFAPQLSALTDVFDSDSAPAGIASFSRGLGAPRTLHELGFRESLIAEAARLAVATPVVNPRPVSAADVEKILSKAMVGEVLQ